MNPGIRRITWTETLAMLREDHRRLLPYITAYPENTPAHAYTHPSFLCVVLYRVSHYFFRGGHRYIARFFWHLNSLLTGSDIAPPADLGPGLVILNPAGVSIMGKAGRNFTVMPCSGLGGEVGRREDVGSGPGLPVLGDDVTLEPFCGVMGPFRIGNRVRIPSGVGIVRDLPDDCELAGPAVRMLRRRDL
jgi:serine O-acetyltransferase